jgi:hypothetical protein
MVSVLTAARKKMAKKKKLKKVKRRIPVAPPGRRHKTKKDYKRVKRIDYRDLLY